MSDSDADVLTIQIHSCSELFISRQFFGQNDWLEATPLCFCNFQNDFQSVV